jgi:hypothetical protein
MIFIFNLEEIKLLVKISFDMNLLSIDCPF